MPSYPGFPGSPGSAWILKEQRSLFNEPAQKICSDAESFEQFRTLSVCFTNYLLFLRKTFQLLMSLCYPSIDNSFNEKRCLFNIHDIISQTEKFSCSILRMTKCSTLLVLEDLSYPYHQAFLMDLLF